MRPPKKAVPKKHKVAHNERKLVAEMLQRWPVSAEVAEVTRGLAQCEHLLASAVQARSLTAALSPEHVYTVNGETFTAVSTLLDAEFGAFESKKPMIIGNMVKTTGVSRAAAARHLETCCALGSGAHAQIEVFFTNPGENAVPSFFAEFFATHLQGRFRLVGAEVRVYDEQTEPAPLTWLWLPLGGRVEKMCLRWSFLTGNTPRDTAGRSGTRGNCRPTPSFWKAWRGSKWSRCTMSSFRKGKRTTWAVSERSSTMIKFIIFDIF